VPDYEGLPFDESLTLALARVRNLDVATSWSAAVPTGAPSDPLPSDPEWAGGSLYVDERSAVVDAPPDQLWQVIEGIGGQRGWYSWPLGWRLRGLVDRVVGGPGLRRGRRHPDHVSVGDAVDWWRVEDVDRGSLLRLRAEMRLPGLAWLELSARTDDQGRTVFEQRALFHPHGLAGHLYWWLIAPFHGIIFGGMKRNIARAAERLALAAG
jgi:hypothetical protein